MNSFVTPDAGTMVPTLDVANANILIDHDAMSPSGGSCLIGYLRISNRICS